METIYKTNKTKVGTQNISVLGIYANRTACENGIDGLKAAGFRNADISALLPTGDSNKEFAHEMQTKLPEGASVGSTSGMLVGGALGWLAGIGALAVPGLGMFIAAGPIMAMLAGIGVGGAVGGLTGALVGLGFPEYEAKRYEGQVKDGGILVSVHCDDDQWKKLAMDVLKQTGATDISSSGEASADTEKSDRPHPRSVSL